MAQSNLIAEIATLLTKASALIDELNERLEPDQDEAAALAMETQCDMEHLIEKLGTVFYLDIYTCKANGACGHHNPPPAGAREGKLN